MEVLRRLLRQAPADSEDTRKAQKAEAALRQAREHPLLKTMVFVLESQGIAVSLHDESDPQVGMLRHSIRWGTDERPLHHTDPHEKEQRRRIHGVAMKASGSGDVAIDIYDATGRVHFLDDVDGFAKYRQDVRNMPGACATHAGSLEDQFGFILQRVMQQAAANGQTVEIFSQQSQVVETA